MTIYSDYAIVSLIKRQYLARSKKVQNLINIIRNANTNIYPNADLNNRIVFAIRGTDDDLKAGDVLKPSYKWIDNDMTDQQLNGTCACKLINAYDIDDIDDVSLADIINKTLKLARQYGKNLALVYGIDTGEIGNDDFASEVVIDDCTVMAVM